MIFRLALLAILFGTLALVYGFLVSTFDDLPQSPPIQVAWTTLFVVFYLALLTVMALGIDAVFRGRPPQRAALLAGGLLGAILPAIIHNAVAVYGGGDYLSFVFVNLHKVLSAPGRFLLGSIGRPPELFHSHMPFQQSVLQVLWFFPLNIASWYLIFWASAQGWARIRNTHHSDPAASEAKPSHARKESR